MTARGFLSISNIEMFWTESSLVGELLVTLNPGDGSRALVRRALLLHQQPDQLVVKDLQVDLLLSEGLGDKAAVLAEDAGGVRAGVEQGEVQSRPGPGHSNVG